MVENRISVNDIECMVGTCVKGILREYHHSIGYEYEDVIDYLSSLVYAKFGENFIVPLELFNINGKELKVQFKDAPNDNYGNSYGSYNSYSHILYIYKNCPKDTEYIKRIIAHELSHSIDKSKRSKTDFDTQKTVEAYSGDTKEYKVASAIMYLFRPTEIQARLTEYQALLKSRPKLVNCYVFTLDNNILSDPKTWVLQQEVNSCLKIKDMYYFLNKLKNYDYTSGQLDNDVDYAQVLLLLSSIRYDIFTGRMGERGKYVNQDKFNGDFNSKEFYKMKKNLIKLLRKRINDMIAKARKIKADAIGVK